MDAPSISPSPPAAHTENRRKAPREEKTLEINNNNFNFNFKLVKFELN